MTTAAVGSAHQQAEKLAADLTGIADRLMTLRGRPDWARQHDALVAAGVAALKAAAKSSDADRARRAADADEDRRDDLERNAIARGRLRTSESDRRTGGPAKQQRAIKKARAATKRT